MAVVRIRDLTFAYGEGAERQPVFDALALEIPNGEVVALLGPSGSGKSTLLKLIGGLLDPLTGTLDLGLAKDGTGYVPQESSLLPWLSVRRNARLGAQLRGKSADHSLSERLLVDFGLMGSWRRLPRTLSGGMKQRVAVVSALTSGADLLLLDEPFSGTDMRRRGAMYSAIRSFVDQGAGARTVLFTTHDLADVFALQAVACCLPDVANEVTLLRPEKGWDGHERSQLLDILSGV